MCGEIASLASKNTLHFEMKLCDRTGICVFISAVKLSGFAHTFLVAGTFFFRLINLAAVSMIHKRYFPLPVDFSGAA